MDDQDVRLPQTMETFLIQVRPSLKDAIGII